MVSVSNILKKYINGHRNNNVWFKPNKKLGTLIVWYVKEVKKQSKSKIKNIDFFTL